MMQCNMTFQVYFDRIYCINLKSRKDRWEECRTEFSEQGLDRVTRINGVTGIPKGFKHSGTMGLDQEDINFPKKLAGSIGCLLSHLRIIKDARKRQYKRILILEDDVQFVPQMQQRFAAILDKIPSEWTMLYFGGNEIGTPERINENVIRVSHMLMTHAVAIDCSVFDELIQMLNECRAPVDVYYAMIQKKHFCYVLYPYLAWQRAGWSDIEQRFRIYDLENLSPSLATILQCKIAD